MAPGPCFMPPAGRRVGRGVRRPLPALPASRPAPELCPRGGTVSSGARLIHEGRTPSLASLSGALVTPRTPPRAPRRVPGRPVLTSRHTGSHHGAAGPGHCAWGAVGGRALMSPRAGAARLALRSLLGRCPRCRVRIASRRARSCQGWATPRRAGTRGARRGRGWGAPHPLLASAPVVVNQSTANQSNGDSAL